MTMSVKESIEISVEPKMVFNLYRDVIRWPVWDSELEAVSLQNGLSLGAEGWLKPQNGPKSKIKITELTENESFVVESYLPLCRIRFGHRLERVNSGTRVTHWVEFSGALGFIFRKLVGNSLQASLPRTLQGLKHACEMDVREL